MKLYRVFPLIKSNVENPTIPYRALRKIIINREKIGIDNDVFEVISHNGYEQILGFFNELLATEEERKEFKEGLDSIVDVCSSNIWVTNKKRKANYSNDFIYDGEESTDNDSLESQCEYSNSDSESEYDEDYKNKHNYNHLSTKDDIEYLVDCIESINSNIKGFNIINTFANLCSMTFVTFSAAIIYNMYINGYCPVKFF